MAGEGSTLREAPRYHFLLDGRAGGLPLPREMESEGSFLEKPMWRMMKSVGGAWASMAMMTWACTSLTAEEPMMADGGANGAAGTQGNGGENVGGSGGGSGGAGGSQPGGEGGGGNAGSGGGGEGGSGGSSAGGAGEGGIGGDAGASGAGGGGADDQGGEGGDEDPGVGVDYEWSQWSIPSDAPSAASYSVTGDTVQDLVTSLVWQRGVGWSRSWNRAKSYCENLAVGGYSDWKLPTRIELESIMSYGRINPAIETTTFSETPSDWFWSSSQYVNDPEYAWPLYFHLGGDRSVERPNRGFRVSSSLFVRCVRRIAPANGAEEAEERYLVMGDTVFDVKTRLTWQRGISEDHFPGALRYCSDLRLGGMAGWRLPTIKELRSLVDVRSSGPAIDTAAFPETPPSSGFWSSTLYANTFFDLPPGYAWLLEFENGTTMTGPVDELDVYAQTFRCVR